MGIKGFKVDFLDRDDQKIADFTYRLAETAAKYRLFLDMHGYHKPAGIQRTYPNVLNFEGVFGLEQMKWTSEKTDMVTYDVTIPFIRMLAGPMDYTQGAMRNATRRRLRGHEPGHALPPAGRIRDLRIAVQHAVRLAVELHARAGMHGVHRLRPDDLG